MSKQNDRDSIVDLLKQYLGLEANDTERFEAIADELCGVLYRLEWKLGRIRPVKVPFGFQIAPLDGRGVDRLGIIDTSLQ